MRRALVPPWQTMAQKWVIGGILEIQTSPLAAIDVWLYSSFSFVLRQQSYTCCCLSGEARLRPHWPSVNVGENVAKQGTIAQRFPQVPIVLWATKSDSVSKGV